MGGHCPRCDDCHRANLRRPTRIRYPTRALTNVQDAVAHEYRDPLRTGARPCTGGSVASLMSKRTKKATLRARKKKANHGRKPNRGRNS